MRKYEKRQSKPMEYDHLVELTCDLCGRKGHRDGWGPNSWEIFETKVSSEISFEEGQSWPDGGNKTRYDFDICPVCFRDILVPFLESKGARVNESESDW